MTHALCRSSRFVCDGSVTSARAGTQSGGRREIFRDEICSCTVAANGSCTDWSCTDVARSFAALLPEVIDPPIPTIGALPVDAFLSKRARKELASALNSLLASPTFAS